MACQAVLVATPFLSLLSADRVSQATFGDCAQPRQERNAVTKFKSTHALKHVNVGLLHDILHAEYAPQRPRQLPSNAVGQGCVVVEQQSLQGDSVAAHKTLAELQTLASKVYVPSSAIAMVQAAIGNRTAALDLLDRAYDEHDFAMAQIHVVPWFQALRDDPRFVALKKKLNLN